MLKLRVCSFFGNIPFLTRKTIINIEREDIVLGQFIDAFFSMKGVGFFSLPGLVAAFIILLPNFTFARKAAATKLDDIETASTTVCLWEVLSRISITIFLIVLEFPNRYDAFRICAVVVMLIYFGLWINFFAKGSYYPDIYLKSFIGIPVPFDTFCVIYFIFVSLWLSNPIAFAFSIPYAFCRMKNAHIAMRDLKSRL